MAFFKSTAIALAALAAGAHALTEPMSSADAETLKAKLISYTAMYDSIDAKVLDAAVSTTPGKGMGIGVGYCTKVSESFAALKCSEFDQVGEFYFFYFFYFL